MSEPQQFVQAKFEAATQKAQSDQRTSDDLSHHHVPVPRKLNHIIIVILCAQKNLFLSNALVGIILTKKFFSTNSQAPDKH